MIAIRKYAAIDIGSNAVRLLINTIVEIKGKKPYFKKTALIRVPIRLGADVFIHKEISRENSKRMQDTIQAFALLMKSHGIEKYRACATSAMRDAKNGEELVKKIQVQTDIAIEIIDGTHEASIIATSDLLDFMQSDKTYLYVDVGGGSTEFTVFSNGKSVVSKSFDLGTIRILNKIIDQSLWEEAKFWIKNQVASFNTIEMVGTGGNINHVFKDSGKKLGKPLTYSYLKSYYKQLTEMSYEERVYELRMKLDRADVVVPATKIYLSAMKWSGAQKIYVPKIGLADGIIKTLYNEEVDRKWV